MRRWANVCVPIAALVAVGSLSCGGGGDGGGMVDSGLRVSFSGSGTASAPDLVRLTGSVSGQQVAVDVVLAGPTTSNDIFAFSFEVEVGDTQVLTLGEVEPTSPALTTDGCLNPAVLAQQNGDRVVIGISKLACPGNGLSAGEHTIATLHFQVLEAGECALTIKGAPATQNSPAGEPTAFDSDTLKIDSIQFDGSAAMIRAI